jgi:Cys-rich four helix bundle protein (predicted Tat secretion target)
MDRREALTAVGALTLAALSSASFAEEEAHPHEHHHHHEGASKYQPLIDAAASCVVKGEACLAHCLVLLGEGDSSMADCAKAVNQMLATCGALQNLASQGSRLVGAMAKVALDACGECEQACKQHADKHAECKACMESCAECVKQCKAFSA